MTISPELTKPEGGRVGISGGERRGGMEDGGNFQTF